MARKQNMGYSPISGGRRAVRAAINAVSFPIKSVQGKIASLRRSLLSGATLSVLAAAMIQLAAAADFFRDGVSANGDDSAANANGGTGTWKTTLTNWGSLAIGGADLAWINGDNYAIFGGAAGTVTLGVLITVHNMTYMTNGCVWGRVSACGGAPSMPGRAHPGSAL